MKKISLLTMAVAAITVTVSNAQANMADPIYMPTNGTTYSKTELTFGEVGTNTVDQVLSQEFGMGISDTAAIRLYSDYTWGDDPMHDFGVGDLGLGATWRAVKNNAWTLDLKGDYIANTSNKLSYGKPGSSWTDKDSRIDLAVEAGYTISDWTFAAEVVSYNYLDTTMEDYSDLYYNAEIQWRTNEQFSTNLAYVYYNDSDWTEWRLEENYSISEDTLVGVYYSYSDRADTLSGEDDSAIGVKFSAQW